MSFLNDIKKRVLVYDGSKGYILQTFGLKPGQSPEEWNLIHPEMVRKLHEMYVDAGCDVIQTNSFTGNRIQLSKYNLGDKVYEINKKASLIAKEAAKGRAYVAASVGPTGVLFEPSGELKFERAYEIFKEQIIALIDGGADILNFETFTDIAEMRAAIIAAKSVTDKPIIASMAFEHNKRTLMGTSPFQAGIIMKRLGSDMIGANCSFGPEHMVDIIKEMSKTGEMISVKPNAGLPELIDGITVYNQKPIDFFNSVNDLYQYNVRLIGGCCGTTPEFIKLIADNDMDNTKIIKGDSRRYITSSVNIVCLDEDYSTGTLIIDDSKNFEELMDESFNLEDYDVIEIIYTGQDNHKLENAVLEITGYLKQPVIISATENIDISNVLKKYPGIAGIRKEQRNNYGAVIA